MQELLNMYRVKYYWKLISNALHYCVTAKSNPFVMRYSNTGAHILYLDAAKFSIKHQDEIKWVPLKYISINVLTLTALIYMYIYFIFFWFN